MTKNNLSILENYHGGALSYVVIDDERYFKISNTQDLRPFFMSVVSPTNHWLFISSNGGISAGRKNSEFALFPYYTDDKITESTDITGSKTIIQAHTDQGTHIWEPYSSRQDGLYRITRTLYKSEYGHKIIFEELNNDLQLAVQIKWETSATYGFIKTTTVINQGAVTQKLTVLDGLQNIVPYGVESYTQNNVSNLVDAYKRSEIDVSTQVGIYALSAIIVDKAEPSEALKTNVVWSIDTQAHTVLASSLQLSRFRKQQTLDSEYDVKAEKGAYFIVTDRELPANGQSSWQFVANVNQSQADVVRLQQDILSDSALPQKVENSIQADTETLLKLNASADALQYSEDRRMNARHFSNVLFNIMRGGVIDDNYRIDREDFRKHVKNSNKALYTSHSGQIDTWPETFTIDYLKNQASSTGNNDFIRLTTEYLPLRFSRRHGDPSRPWNKFSINTNSEIDGSKILDYEGNWRDIFQNWEALAHSYPLFIESMIYKFLNASTFDGYNPYRVTRGGFDWEIIEPDDPWSYIGYWGDHQIIYLLKFLEFCQDAFPGTLADLCAADHFVYADVPYVIKSFDEIVENAKDTISFDHDADESIRARRDKIGADGALLYNQNGVIHSVNFIEKILATVSAKLSNLVAGGGIWMNTQRPEWNDANNALVGNGLSMVTLYYLHRFLKFLQGILDHVSIDSFELSSEFAKHFSELSDIIKAADVDRVTTDDNARYDLLKQLGHSASNYRLSIYAAGFTGEKAMISRQQVRDTLSSAISLLQASIRVNKRPDGLYHAYNLIGIEEDKATVDYLDEMLEGQVAVLSADYLSAEECVNVLQAMERSAIYRPDQSSYLLYPNKSLPSFLERNKISAASLASSALLQELLADGQHQIIEKDLQGNVRFNGQFKNAEYLEHALQQSNRSVSPQEIETAKEVYEATFNHKAFTGRSGTFYGYEGLGSIYWHMVSKLLLATMENCVAAERSGAEPLMMTSLAQCYHTIQEGIGVHKTPALYGAFPTDPYSHTPGGKGAQQPGMTGQVKEDILSRLGELGVFISNGSITFKPFLLLPGEFTSADRIIEYVRLDDTVQTLALPKDSIFFTYCQTPIIYRLDGNTGITIFFMDGNVVQNDTYTLPHYISEELFNRSGNIQKIEVHFTNDLFKYTQNLEHE